MSIQKTESTGHSDIKVSVIVPVYNVEKYLRKCLDSLVNQSLEEIEIVIVNDGSPDNSQSIIDEYTQLHPGKITALKQENKGLGAARNYGIENARGEYIGFVDSDDWVEPDMFELLYNNAKENDSDAVMCDINRYNETDGDCVFTEVWRGSRDNVKSVAEYVLASTIVLISCNKIFRRQLVRDTPFPNTYFAEDMATTPNLLSYCKNISYLPKPLYNYLKRKGSLTVNTVNPNMIEIVNAWERCLSDCNPEYTKEIEYAVYLSVYDALVTKKQILPDILKFLLKNKSGFIQNRYIKTEISHNPDMDLFGLADDNDDNNINVPGQAVSAYNQVLADFLTETKILTERLEELPESMLKELQEMYNSTFLSATDNTGVNPKFYVMLYDRLECIRKNLKNA